MQHSCCLLLFLLSLILGVCCGDAKVPPVHMRIAVVSVPLYGHFLPLKSVAHELSNRGHEVTYFIEKKEWCNEKGKDNIHCFLLPPSQTFPASLFEKISAKEDAGETFMDLFQEMLRHHKNMLPILLRAFTETQRSIGAFDLVLTDLSTFAGFSVAEHFSLPYISLFPLTMHMTIGPATYLPSLGTGWPRNLSIAQRWTNFIIKNLVPLHTGFSLLDELNKVRAENGILPYRSASEIAGMESVIMSPTIWGYDIAQPLCPNILPLGLMVPEKPEEFMESTTTEFLEKHEACKNFGALYVNFGTLAVLSDEAIERLTRALLRIRQCVVWKISRENQKSIAVRIIQEASAAAADSSVSSRFLVAPRFNSPTLIMEHTNTRVFLTHCGDTSIGEAILAELPVVGIPVFADQVDVCQRVQESGIGVYVGRTSEFTSEGLATAVENVAEDHEKTFINSVRKVKEVGLSLGGATAGADWVEKLMVPVDASSVETPASPTPPRFKFIGNLLACRHDLSPSLPQLMLQQQYDVTVLGLVATVCTLTVLTWFMKRLYSCIRDGGKSKKKKA